MNHGLVSKPGVKGSEEGIRRRRADYLVLKYLQAVEVASVDTLNHGVKQISQLLQQKGYDAPVTFESGGSNGVYSREVNEALDRCLHFDWVEKTYDKKYGIRDDGISIVTDRDKFHSYGVSLEFQDAVQEAIEECF